MTNLLRSASFLALVGGLAAGCAIDAGDDATIGDDQEPTTAETAQAVGLSCPKWICGGNDPKVQILGVGDVFYHELNENGVPNDEGFSVVGIVAGPLIYRVDVAHGELRGKRPGFPDLVGGALVGKILRVKYAKNAISAVIDYHIDNVGSTSLYPAGPGVASVPTYELSYLPGPGGEPLPMCSNPGSLTGENDTLGQDPWSVVFFEGDRWWPKEKKYRGFDVNWFNIGCAGHLLSKMDLLYHTSVTSGLNGKVTTVDQRQALMKMFSADYCGDGTVFTISGQPLGWTDDKNWSPYFYAIPALTLEARWTSTGPKCLEEPRLTGSVDPLVLSLFGPDINAKIDAHCGASRPKKCTDIGQSTDVTKTYGNWLVTANP